MFSRLLVDVPTFTVGDRVVLFAWGGCRKCVICRSGNNNCRTRNTGPSRHQYGFWMDGGCVILAW